MARPKKHRMIKQPPPFCQFKPLGIPQHQLDSIVLTIDEYEAIRLADYEGLSHADAAEQMFVSRSTFSRLIEAARKKFAKLLVEGKSLDIEGGDVHFHEDLITCGSCGHHFTAKMDERDIVCPECESRNLEKRAEQLGHGRCCRGFGRRRRRNQS